MKKVQKIMLILMAIVALVVFSGCSNKSEKGSKNKTTESTSNVEQGKIVDENNPVATMVVEYVNENGNKEEGTIKIELYPDVAPDTVANFINLANNNFYNGLTFHRIIENFMIQGGDPNGNGTGGASLSDLNKNINKGSSEDYNYSIKGEFATNNFRNNIKFEAGTIAMARSDYSTLGMAEEGYNSACSQFFIMNTDDKSTNSYLEGNYAAFGKVIEGYDVVTKISKTEVTVNENGTEQSMPKDAPVIKELSVDTK